MHFIINRAWNACRLEIVFFLKWAFVFVFNKKSSDIMERYFTSSNLHKRNLMHIKLCWLPYYLFTIPYSHYRKKIFDKIWASLQRFRNIEIDDICHNKRGTISLKLWYCWADSFFCAYYAFVIFSLAIKHNGGELFESRFRVCFITENKWLVWVL